jgi:hypothetical protein
VPRDVPRARSLELEQALLRGRRRPITDVNSKGRMSRSERQHRCVVGVECSPNAGDERCVAKRVRCLCPCWETPLCSVEHAAPRSWCASSGVYCPVFGKHQRGLVPPALRPLSCCRSYPSSPPSSCVASSSHAPQHPVPAGMVTVLQNTTVLSVRHFAKVHANKCTATGVPYMAIDSGFCSSTAQIPGCY